MKREIIISGDISTASFGDFMEHFNLLLETDSTSPITVVVCTEGGSALAALAYYDFIRQSPCKVVMKGMGIIASAAALIFAAGHERYMAPSAWFMVHDDGCEDLTGLRVSQGIKKLQHQARLEVQWNDLMAAAVPGTTAAEWDEYHKEEIYFSARECLQNGFIDGILGEKNERYL